MEADPEEDDVRGAEGGSHGGKVDEGATFAPMPADATDAAPSATAATFRDLNLGKALWNALDDLGLEHPTYIQRESFPVIMSGRDVVGIAQTGTGKTLAYLLPALRQWRFVKHAHPQILIVVPTRELVEQVVEQVELLTKYMDVVTRGIYGGANIKTQQTVLQEGLDVLVATPGRLMDIALTGTVKFKFLRKLIIDEIDEMLELGFKPQLINVLDMMPERRQNLLFSATVTPAVEKIIDDMFERPVYITAARSGTPLEGITQRLYRVANFNTKVNLLESILADRERFRKTLVFAPSKRLADVVAERLERAFPEEVAVIHSNKAQNTRFSALRRFANGEARLLVATDLVSRGLDIEGVTHVISMDIPTEPEAYIHRIGRTGRADATGEAIAFATERELGPLAHVEGLMKREIERVEFPEDVPVSEALIPEERPRVFMPTLATKLRTTGGATHERSDKRKKEQRGNRKANALRAKMKAKGRKKRR